MHLSPTGVERGDLRLRAGSEGELGAVGEAHERPRPSDDARTFDHGAVDDAVGERAAVPEREYEHDDERERGSHRSAPNAPSSAACRNLVADSQETRRTAVRR